MEIYMRMLGINKAVLNQCLSTDSSENSSFAYYMNEKLWHKVLEGLRVFVAAKSFQQPTT